MSHPFRALPADPPTHLRLWLYAAVVQVSAYLDAVGADHERFPFLDGYLGEMRALLPDAKSPAALGEAWRAALARWELRLTEPDRFPLRRLVAAGLSAPHLMGLMLAGLVEIDARFGQVYAALHPLPDETRLSAGLLEDLLRTTGAAPLQSGWNVAHDLAGRGLILIRNADAPRAARALAVSEPVWDALTGAVPDRPGLRYHAPDAFSPLETLGDVLPPDFVARLRRLPDLLLNGTLQAVMLQGMQGSGRLRALGAVARKMGRGVLLVEPPDAAALPELLRHAAPLATLLNAVPAVAVEPAAGETVSLPPLTGYHGPVGLIVGQDGGVSGALLDACVTLRVPPARLDARQRRWSGMLADGQDGATIQQVSERYHLTIGGVERAARLAQAYARLNGRDRITVSDVQDACRSANRHALDALATFIDTAQGAWDDLIVSDSTQTELDNLVLRCKHRERVLGHLGRGFSTANRGVRALFSGPSGTGKTLAARLLVGALGLDLYRVDLSAVVNKYIGETERNLSKLFARAEELDVVLLLDEGDSLMTGRTDVRSSNDRYANMETNYLLQRLETYEGILIITTNQPARIDNAFQRRMDAHVEFSAPNAAQRYAIWRLHLPDEHALDDAALRTVAARCAFSGGQIRSAALHSTVLALEDGSPLRPAHLLEAVAREYRKMGASSPLTNGSLAS